MAELTHREIEMAEWLFEKTMKAYLLTMETTGLPPRQVYGFIMDHTWKDSLRQQLEAKFC